MRGRRLYVEKETYFQRPSAGYPRPANRRYSRGVVVAFIEDGQSIFDVDCFTVASSFLYI
jgi:hypothetical protein